MRLLHPWWLLLLVVLPAVWWWATRRPKPTLSVSSTAALSQVPPGAAIRWSRMLPVLRLSVLAAVILGLARPQAGSRESEVETEGLDIILTLDLSGSMRAMDFKPTNRLGAAKEAARAFIRKRQHDRIGLVVFAKHAFTQCPLTLDYGVLERLLDEVELGMIEDSTAIGTAIAVSANRLRRSPAKSTIMVLLTDGENNAGEIDPVTAARAAAAVGIKIYTIGAGGIGSALVPIDDPVLGRRYERRDIRIDEAVLREIARLTGGTYFRAKDSEGLARVYEDINQLEKTKIEATEYVHYEEKSGWLVWPAAVLLLIELGLRRTWLLEVP